MSLADAAAVLQAADPDRLAALTLLPPDRRPALIALYALAAELARVPGTSAEPMLAEIRLQWWVDELARLPASAGLHPLLDALAEAGGLAPGDLSRLAEGQRPACAEEPFDDPAEVLDWIDATTGAMTWTAAQALGADGAAEAAVRAQGRALGVAAAILRGTARPIDAALHESVRMAGLDAAAKARAARLPRALAPVLYAPAPLRAALAGRAQPSEFARRRALLSFLVGRDWRFDGRR